MRPLQCLLILLIVLLPAGPFATTFPVTKTADTNDGVCDPDCSLREAIDAANTNPGADDVPVPAGLYLLTLGQLTITDDVSIAGTDQATTIIDGNVNMPGRVFWIQSNTVVEISSVTIQNGGSPDYQYDPLLIGGGILNSGDLALTDTTVRRNQATDFLFQGFGGGIFNDTGTLSLYNTTVSGNGVAGSGGGIFNQSGTVNLTDSTVVSNGAGSGGGIDNGGILTLTNSTVSGNDAVTHAFDGFGGGIWNSGDMTLTNSTVSGNQAGYYDSPYLATGRGGGILNSGAGTARMINGTVTGNRAYESGGGISNFNALSLTGTIVADNVVDNCGGSVDSLGYNLADDTSCGFTQLTDLVVADAMLGPLQDNGGPTETHDLLPGSPAIDAGSANCPPPATDQRGVSRPQDAGCDIGAVEFVPEPHNAPTLVAGAALLALLYRRR